MTTRQFPPEWSRQSAVLIAWPSEHGDFGRWFRNVESTYVHIATAIGQHENLIIACHGEHHRRSIIDSLGRSGLDTARVQFATAEYDDIWVRDTAPLTVETPDGPLLLDFRFNGWGGKYACAHDAVFGEALYSTGLFGSTARETIDFVLEGGSIETDGSGTLLTTQRCLLNPNRNPELAVGEIESELRRRFGASRVLWLHHGHAEGDDTDAHVDTLARFCSRTTIAYTTCELVEDPHYANLKAMESELRSFRTANGEPYRLVPLPIPLPILDEHGQRLPATYANFLVINEAVLLPVYGDPNDERAQRQLAGCFPDREIVGIDCRPLIHQFGSLHCMTMQYPASISIAAP